MLEPKKIKRRKQHRYRGTFRRKATRGALLSFGTVGLKAQEPGELTARQIEAARRALTHSVQRGGKIWIRVFPHIPVSRKAAEVPMGSGKGSLDHYSAIVRAGTMIFEMGGLPEQTARTALALAAYKLPIRTKIVTASLL